MSTLLSLLLVLPTSAATPPQTAQDKAEKVEASAPTAGDPALKEVRAFLEKRSIDKSVPVWKTQLPMPPKLTFDPASDYFWRIETNKGPIKVRLLPEVAPMHVSSTIFLTEVGFYDGLAFHRVIPGFMAQGGCPLGTGTGNPGYSYEGEVDPKVKHDRPGLLSMANTGRPMSDGSQFFLTFVPTPHLDMRHTIFGEVVEGMETLRELERQGTPSGKTKEALTMTKATIVVEPKAEKKATAPKAEAKQGQQG